MEHFSFSESFSRVKDSTEIKKLTQLADFVGITQPAVSKAKKKGQFPTEWAVALEREYGLRTLWILTGEGPKYNQTEKQPNSKPEHERQGLPAYLWDLAEWATEMSGAEGFAWLQKQLDICLPTFKMWREQKNGAAEAAIHQDQVEKKVA